MEVRKFEAFSMNDAIRLVKKELGKDAVILSTREKERLGVEGGRPLKVVEVVAAAAASLRAEGNEAAAAAVSKAQGSSGRVESAGRAREGFGTLHGPGETSGNARTVEFPRVGRQSQTTIVRGSPTLGALAPQTKQALVSGRASGGAREAAGVSHPNAVFAQGGVPELSAEQRARLELLGIDVTRAGRDSRGTGSAGSSGTGAGAGAFTAANGAFGGASGTSPSSSGPVGQVARASEDVRELREELTRVRRDLETLPQVNVGEQMQEIKVLLHDLMRARAKEDETRFHEYLADIAVRLRAAGVREAIVTECLQTVGGVEIPRPDGAPLSGARLREFYLSQTIRVLFRQLGVTGHWRFDHARPSVVCLVGPTGVGKTTTIAKLAARLKLTDGRPVALASMDTFRIGGADQLRVYSKILDCPFAEASEPQDLVEFVARQHGAQVVLVDTAGRNARHQSQMEGLQRLASADLPIAFHLVLAASMKQRDLDENLKAYRPLEPESLLFTKLDESWSYGEILNCSLGSRTPLSYFTTGQKVPEDLEPATKERVVERLFRL